MNKTIPLILFFFLFFFLINTNQVLAFESFSLNPNFALGLNYYLIEDYGSYESTCYFLGFIPYGCINQSKSFNYTVSNKSLNFWSSNTTILMATTTGEFINETLRISPLNQNLFLHTNNYSESEIYQDNYNYFSVVPNTEILIYLRYRINGTDNLLPTGTKLYIYISKTSNPNDFSLYTSYELNPINNQKTTKNFTLPPVLYDTFYYKFIMQFRWTGMLNTTTVEIDKFDVFTFDKSQTAYATVFNDDYAKFSCNTTTTPTTLINSVLGNATRNASVKMSYYNSNAYNNYSCIILQMNQTVITRRLDFLNFPAYFQVWKARDFLIPYYDNPTTKSGLILTKVYPTFVESTRFGSYPASGANAIHLIYNIEGDKYVVGWCGSGTPCEIWNNSVMFKTIYYTYGNGLYFKLQEDSASTNTGWLSFYSTSCQKGFSCTNNTLYYIQSDCTINYIRDCGLLGCNVNQNNCNLPINPFTNEEIENYGSYCYDNYTYFTISESGTVIGSCVYPEICLQTSNTTIKCINPAKIESEQAKADPFSIEKQSGLFGSMLGFGSTGGKFMIGLIIVLAIMISINISFSKVSKGGELPKEMNIIIILMLLVGFTIYIPLFDPILLIIIVLFGAVLLATKFRGKIIGQKED